MEGAACYSPAKGESRPQAPILACNCLPEQLDGELEDVPLLTRLRLALADTPMFFAKEAPD